MTPAWAPAPNKRALGSLQDLDALQVRRIHIEVATRELTRLLIEIDGHVRKAVDRASGLGSLVPDAQAAHEDLGLTGPDDDAGHVGQVFDEVIEIRDIQLRSASRR